MIGRFQYQTLAAPLVESQALETREGFLQQPDPVRRRGLSAALLTAALVVGPLVVPSVDPVAQAGGRSIATGGVPIFQYQTLAGPLFIETAAAFPDSPYAISYPARLHRPRALHAAYHPAYVADKFTAPTAATVTENSWGPRYPDRHNPLKGLSARYHPAYVADRFDAPTNLDTAPTLSWQPDYPDKHTYRRATSLRLPVHEIFAVQVEVPVMSWTGLYLDPPVVRKTRRALQTFSTQPFDVETTVQPPAPALSWQPDYPDLVWPERRSLAALVADTRWNIYLADITVTAPASSWQGHYEDRVLPRITVRVGSQPAFFFDRFDAPDEVVAPDLAVPVYPDVVRGRTPINRPNAGTSPIYIPDVTDPATAHSWDPMYPDSVWRFTFPARQQVAWASSIFITDVTSPAPALSWQPEYPDRIVRYRMHASRQDDLNWNTEVPPIVVVEEVFGRGRYTVPPRRRVFIVPPRRRNWTV